MGDERQTNLVFLLLCVLSLLFLATAASGQSQVIPFDSDRWQVTEGEIVHNWGGDCFSGTAILHDVEFENGVIEVDLVVDGSRSYPGLGFRMQSDSEYEWFYVRPHRAGLYPDALQYTPVFHRVAGWQLYNGPGYTAAAELPANEWLHLKLEVSGRQARVHLGNSAEPVLTIYDLKHGVSSGTIGVLGPNDRTACFANFSYTTADPGPFGEPPAADTASGTVRDWELSRPYKAEQANRDAYPGFYAIFGANWQHVTPEPSGLLDIARFVGRSEGGPDLVLARSKIRSDSAQDITFSFGYSDEVDLFFNGRKIFAGNSSYHYRDPSFLGIIGLYDHVTLRLEKGLNEILMMVTETLGGWGLMGEADIDLQPPIKDHHLTKVWETDATLLTPESVLYDPVRDILYVTSFDAQFATASEPTGYISKVTLDGEIRDHNWVTGLNAPTGMSIYDDRLYTLERAYLTEIDLDSGEIMQRYPMPDVEFPNDLSVDSQGNIYITDTRSSAPADSRIYRFKDGEFQVWLNEGINASNGAYVYEDKLLVGNSGDGFLKAVDLDSKRITKVTSLGAGVIDGIRVDTDGNYLVSHWSGQVYSISPQGQVVEILDMMEQRLNTADFELVSDRKLLVIPTFLGNRVVAYRID
jgi:sugar lactone lactonase YvrE